MDGPKESYILGYTLFFMEPAEIVKHRWNVLFQVTVGRGREYFVVHKVRL